MSGEKLKALMAKFPTEVRLTAAWEGSLIPEGSEAAKHGLTSTARIGFSLDFSETGFGCGEIMLMADEAGRVVIDTETMGKKRALKYLTMLIEQAIDDNDMDPERHALYNEIRGRRCGSDCKACYPDPGIQ